MVILSAALATGNACIQSCFNFHICTLPHFCIAPIWGCKQKLSTKNANFRQYQQPEMNGGNGHHNPPARRVSTSNLLFFLRYHLTKIRLLRAKLHYTDTGYEQRLRTLATNTTNGWAHNKFTTNGQKFATSKHLDMSRCWALALRCGKFVVELLWARPLVVSVAGVHSRCPCSGVWA